MPSGYVPGLPKRVAESVSTPTWGTVEYQNYGGSWNVATATLADPGENGFWACCTSQASNGYTYLMGTSQMATRAASGGIEAHNGTNGWTSVMFTLMERYPGATWSSTINIDMHGSYRSSSCALFTYTEGFQRIPYGWTYAQWASAFPGAHTSLTNLGPYPGGVAFAMCSKESGAASGITGIDSASQSAGWVFAPNPGALSALAYYILSTTEIETPPTVTFTSTTSRDCWITASGYVR